MMSTEIRRDAGLRKEPIEMMDPTNRVAVRFSSPVAPAITGNENERGNQQQQTPPANSGDQSQQTSQQQTDAQHEENAVAKAYNKLREAESAKEQLEKENRQLKPENEDLKTKNQNLEKQNQELQEALQMGAAEGVARIKGFTDPEAAVAVLLRRGTDLSDRSKAEKALDDYAKEKGLQVTQQAPPSGGPINPQTSTTPAGNAGMNDMIRRSAGRA